MGDIEVRRVQRVGSSSLVVTLPKSWARRLGLEQGSTVLLYDEGDSIRVVPARRGGGGSVWLDLSRMPPLVAVGVPVCTYLSGFDRVEVVLPEGVSGEDLKVRALGFMGMHVYESGPRRVVVETLLDMEKIDADAFIKSLGIVSDRLIGGLVGLIRGELEGGVGRVEFARNDFMRTLYVVLRSLFSRSPREGAAREAVFKLMSASYVSLAIEMLYNVLPLLEGSAGLGDADRERVVASLEELGRMVSMLLHIIPNPSVRRLAGLLDELRAYMERLVERIRESESPLAGAVLSKVHDSARVVMLAAYITVCRIIARLAGEAGEGAEG